LGVGFSYRKGQEGHNKRNTIMMTQASIDYRKAMVSKIEAAKTTATKYNGMSHASMEALIAEIKADYKNRKSTINDMNNCYTATMECFYKQATPQPHMKRYA